jgi:hypothetical protein
MSARLYLIVVGFLAMTIGIIYGSIKAVLWLKPSLIALAKYVRG